MKLPMWPIGKYRRPYDQFLMLTFDLLKAVDGAQKINQTNTPERSKVGWQLNLIVVRR